MKSIGHEIYSTSVYVWHFQHRGGRGRGDHATEDTRPISASGNQYNLVQCKARVDRGIAFEQHSKHIS